MTKHDLNCPAMNIIMFWDNSCFFVDNLELIRMFSSSFQITANDTVSKEKANIIISCDLFKRFILYAKTILHGGFD